MTPEQSGELRRPFPADSVGVLPKPTKRDAPKGACRECGGFHGLPAVHLDFVGHANVTDRLLSVDPEWNWEPLAVDEHGLPMRDRDGCLWIKLTVCGVTRLGVSDPRESWKEQIGNAIRNAAMRYGVALNLWTKDELESQLIEPEPVAENPRQTSGAPQTPGDHEDQRSRALIASHTKRWAEAGDAWRVDELKRRRDAAGWPQALLEYDRAQLAAAVSACVAIDKLDGPQGPQEPQDGPGEAEPPDGSARSMQGEGEAVAPTAGDVSTRSDAVSSAEPAAAPKPAGRRKT